MKSEQYEWDEQYEWVYKTNRSHLKWRKVATRWGRHEWYVNHQDQIWRLCFNRYRSGSQRLVFDLYREGHVYGGYYVTSLHYAMKGPNKWARRRTRRAAKKDARAWAEQWILTDLEKLIYA